MHSASSSQIVRILKYQYNKINAIFGLEKCLLNFERFYYKKLLL